MQSNQVCCPAADISYQLILLHKNVGFQLLKKPRKYALCCWFRLALQKKNTCAYIGAKFKGQKMAGYQNLVLLFSENLL